MRPSDLSNFSRSPSLVNRDKRARPCRTAEIHNAFSMEGIEVRPSDLSNSKVPTLHTNQNQRKNAKGAPGLAFETWDPRNQCFMDTHDVTTGKQTRQNLPSP